MEDRPDFIGEFEFTKQPPNIEYAIGGWLREIDAWGMTYTEIATAAKAASLSFDDLYKYMKYTKCLIL